MCCCCRYTHDPLPPSALASASAALRQCSDTPGTVARESSGRALTCEDLAQLCSSHPQVADVCQRTCGACRTVSSKALADVHVRWLPLLWKNLPSDPHVAPSVSSPYHYRCCCCCCRCRRRRSSFCLWRHLNRVQLQAGLGNMDPHVHPSASQRRLRFISHRCLAAPPAWRLLLWPATTSECQCLSTR